MLISTRNNKFCSTILSAGVAIMVEAGTRVLLLPAGRPVLRVF